MERASGVERVIASDRPAHLDTRQEIW